MHHVVQSRSRRLALHSMVQVELSAEAPDVTKGLDRAAQVSTGSARQKQRTTTRSTVRHQKIDCPVHAALV